MDLVSKLSNTYFDSFTKRVDSNERQIGLELEFQLVDANGAPPELEIVISLFDHLRRRFNWKPMQSCGIYHGIENPNRYEQLSFESGRVCIEYSSPFFPDLYLLEKEVIEKLEEIVGFLGDRSFFLFGGGINPKLNPSAEYKLNIDRYYFVAQETNHNIVPVSVGNDFLAFILTSHNSPHIDVDSEEAVDAFYVLNALSGLQIALTANSAVWKGDVDGSFKSLRCHFYEEIFANRNDYRTIPRHFQNSQEEYIYYLLASPAFLVFRDNYCYRIMGHKTLMDYYSTSESKAVDFRGNIITVSPRAEDLEFNDRFIWTNSRLRSSFGTIESRCSCQQPQDDLMCVSALILGIISNLNEAKEFTDSRTLDEWMSTYQRSIRMGLTIAEETTYDLELLTSYLEISKEGLLKRGLGEEIYLTSLYDRLKSGKGPADEMIDRFKEGANSLVIKEFTYHKRLKEEIK